MYETARENGRTVPSEVVKLETTIKGYSADVTIMDGTMLSIRPVLPEDMNMLSDFIRRTSRQSLRLRFFGSYQSPEENSFYLSPDASTGYALLATRQGVVVGHAAFYYTDKEKKTAEVSVLVGDDFRGRGIGTALLQLLSEIGSKAGVEEFTLAMLPENIAMINVVTTLGFPFKTDISPGSIIMSFPTSLSDSVIQKFDQRDAIATKASIKSFLEPRSVAVIGASKRRGSIGWQLFRNIIEGEYTGIAYPVNPDAVSIQSVQSFKSVLDCPGPVDLAFIVVPARFVIQVADECGRKGVHSLVVISSGFSEMSGDQGTKMQEDLLNTCRKYGMRLIGPNCMGIVSTDQSVRLNGQFAPFKPREGNLSFLSQSGALGIAVIQELNSLGLGLSSFVSVGNKADISGNDLIQYWEDDSKTDVVLMYLESFGNPRKFSRIARRVSQKKPIIVVKSGRTVSGSRAAKSHTGAMVSASDITVDALLSQSGVIRAQSLRELFDFASILSTQPLPQGNGVGIITNAGGAGILAADACEASGLKVIEFSESVQDELGKMLPSIASLKNPVDMTAGATADDYYKAIMIACKEPGIHSLIVLFVPPIEINAEDVGKRILDAARDLKGRVTLVSVFLASTGLPEMLSTDRLKIPSFKFPEEAAGALARAVEYSRWRNEPKGTFVHSRNSRFGEAASIVAAVMGRGEEWLSLEETIRLLSIYGVDFLKTEFASSPEVASSKAAMFGQKVVLKVDSKTVLHKTDVGGVKLNLESTEVFNEAVKMKGRVEALGHKVDGFILQAMAEPGLEMFVGVTHDPDFGPIIACGYGGTYVEAMKDISVRITPLTDIDADSMLKSLRTYTILKGYRGEKPYDTGALTRLILAVNSIVEDIPEIQELDLNPVIVRNQGITTVDARIRVGKNRPEVPEGAKRITPIENTDRQSVK